VDTNNTRLRIATRIHFALLRHLGEGIDVGTMLKNDAEAREVLWVCEACGDAELLALARQYVRAGMLSDEARAGGHAAQDTPWARDTSGFGVSHPPEMPEAHDVGARKRTTIVSSNWLNPANWLRRDHH
jgi:hypothetical protein